MKDILFRSFVGVLIAALVVYLSPVPYAYANPVLQNQPPIAGGNIASAGSATVKITGNTETITQTTGNAVIDWSSFNIGGKETTKFVDPNSSALTVSRIHDMNPSQILGTLTSNGNVVLINPNGVFFGQGSTVDVNGLLATTSNVSNAAVMSGGRMNFTPGTNPDAAVVNQGTITAKDAGLIGLVAPNVLNSGIITAKLGSVHMASGDTFYLDFYGDGLMGIGVSDAVKQQIVQNTGSIEADGGTIKLTAAAGRQIVNSLIDVEGELHAPAFSQHEGVIHIYAEGSNAVPGNVAANKGQKQGTSTVMVSGVLDATNTSGTGGSISVLGDNVGIMGGAILDASGTTGGGNIKIGGDFHGAGTTPTALNTYVDPNAYIFANAMNVGNGGNVAVWSDGHTWFGGNIYARGGQQSGNGGFVETSGHGQLDADGYVDLTAANGAKGTYLLDPATIEIYGNVTPAFNATDSSISLSSALQLWLDASDTSNVTLSYNSLGVTASGTSGGNTITTSSNIASSLAVGERIQLGGSTHSYAASVNDNSSDGVYTITGISGTTVTLDANLGSTYSGSTLYGGYVSTLTDKSGNGNTVSQITAGSMPLWISNSQNSLGQAVFSNDWLTASSSTLPTGSSAWSLFSTLSTNTTNTAVGGWGNNAYNGARFNLCTCGGNLGVETENYIGGQIAISTNTAYVFSDVYSGGSNTNSIPNLNGSSSGYTSGSNFTPNVSNTQIVIGSTPGAIGAGNFSGKIGEYILYNTNLSTNAQALINQYQSAKWGIALTPPGTGATEAAQAMASNGYSVFADTYLQRLSNSANIALSATGNVTLDLQGDNMSLASGKSLSITAGSSGTGNITFISPGTLTTNNASITLTPGTTSGSIVTNSSSAVTLASQGGSISLAGPVSLGSALTVNSGGGAVSFGSTVDGAQNLNVNSGAGGTTFSGKIGGTTPIGALNVTGPATVDANITTNNSAITFNNAVTLGGNSVWNSGTATATLASTLAASIYSFGLTADSLSLGGNLTGTGTITIQPNTGSTALHINDGTNSGLYLTNTELGYVSNASWSGITIGSTSGTGNMTVGGSTWNSPVTFNNGSGKIEFSGAQTLGGNSLTAVSNSGNIQLDASATITSTASSGNSIVLAAGGNFVNNAGSSALAPGSGTARWIVYSTQASSDTNGASSLNPAQTIYGQNYGSEAPGSVPNAGQNTWLYDYGLLTVTATSQTITYGSSPNLTATAGTTYSYSCNPTCGSNPITAGPTISVSGVTTSATSGKDDAGTWNNSISVSGATAAGYSILYAAGNLIVNPMNITVTAATNSRTYNGTTSAAATPTVTSGSIITGDTGNFTETYASKNAGTGLTLTQAGSVTDGNGGNNYSVTFANNNTGVITAEAITVTAATNTRTYNGTTTATATPTVTSGTIFAGDSANFSETYGSKNVGTGLTLTPSGSVTDGNGGNNYSVTFANNNTGVITAEAITVTANSGQSVVYGSNIGTLTYTLTSGSVMAGDSLSGALTTAEGGAGTAATHANSLDVGSYPIIKGTLNVSDGNGGNNYAITYAGANLTVTPLAITVASGVTANSKTYDGTTTDTLTFNSPALAGTVAGDTVSVDPNSAYTANFNDATVANNKPVTVAGLGLTGAQSADYTLTQPAGLTANINGAVTSSGGGPVILPGPAIPTPPAPAPVVVIPSPAPTPSAIPPTVTAVSAAPPVTYTGSNTQVGPEHILLTPEGYVQAAVQGLADDNSIEAVPQGVFVPGFTPDLAPQSGDAPPPAKRRNRPGHVWRMYDPKNDDADLPSAFNVASASTAYPEPTATMNYDPKNDSLDLQESAVKVATANAPAQPDQDKAKKNKAGRVMRERMERLVRAWNAMRARQASNRLDARADDGQIIPVDY